MTDKIDAAQALARRGFCVFPLAINGKTPALDGNWQKLATTDPARIRQLWSCPVFEQPIDYNIGVAIGPDTVVVDVDVRDGKPGAKSLALWEAINDPLPDTYEVTTASGGRHLYFRSERSGSFPAKLAEGIDLKDHGDYVVGPGSEIDGAAYRRVDQALCERSVSATGGGKNFDREMGAAREGDITPLPDSVVRGITFGKKRNVKSADRENQAIDDLDSAGDIARAVHWLTAEAPEAVEGAGGDRITFEVAARVGDFGVSRAECLDLMVEHWNDTKAFPPWDLDALADKVANAYDYRQNAIGNASPGADFENVEAEVQAREAASRAAKGGAPQRRGLYFVAWEDAKPNLDRPYLIEDVIDAGAMIVTYGDSNVGKTYVKLDMAFSIAAGRDWNGHKVRQGLVVYVAAEGGTGFTRRIEAFRKHYKADKLPFALVPCPIDLQSDQADTGKLIKVIREAEERFGQKCVLIVVDTLARAMAGGDENTATDMGKFVGHCDRLRIATEAAVDIVHHTGKDKSKGARGSSALRAATDTELEVTAGTVTVAKQRDMAPTGPARFRLIAVEVGHKPDGKAVTACVVEWPIESEFEVKLTPLASQFLEKLSELVAARQDEADEMGADKADISVPWRDWQMSGFLSLTVSDSKPISRTYLFKLRAELVTNGLVEKTKSGQWLTKNCH